MPLPPPGTFRLYSFAEPPLRAGRFTLSGDVAGLPGPVETLNTTVDVVAPRYALPPNQILGTFPPAGARGSFTSRLPQVVLRRRTLPWERSPDHAPGATPAPWLALVLIAEGEAQLHSDVPVEQCVTEGVTLQGERDVPKSACIEVPQRVVNATFPTRDDLAMLTHVREVDIRDTELAMGDDDGWMAVVLCNRLPQPNTRYLACLVNLENQYGELPTVPEVELELDYLRDFVVADLRVAAAETLGTSTTLDRAVMGLSSVQAIDPVVSAVDAAAAPTNVAGPAVRSASGATARTGAGWAATTAAASSTSSATLDVQAVKMALADGFAYPAKLLRERTVRFPVLAYWSFTCTERGDFRYLAEHVTSRLLGYVPTPSVPETPDGDAPPAGGAPPPANRPEESATRPLPLVSETGHIQLDTVTRRGDPARAWFRGPLVPTPVERATTRLDGASRPPLAHHADQLRRVVPDGHEDLGYAAAFEIGRLLALSQPGVAAALGRWRHEAFSAARARVAITDALNSAPVALRDMVSRPDPLTDDTAAKLRPGGAGRRTVRALFQVLGETPAAIAPSRPLADPAAAADDLHKMVGGQRDTTIVAGLGLEQGLSGVAMGDQAAVAGRLAETPAVVAGDRNLDIDLRVMRQTLEDEAGRLADSAELARRAGIAGVDVTGANP